LCWISGYKDPYGCLVETAHIIDRVLCTPEQAGDVYNTIRCCAHIHRALDARTIKICPDTGLVTSDYYTQQQMKQLGIQPGTALDPLAMVPERRAFLAARINDYEEFEHTKAAHLARKAKQDAEGDDGVA